MTRPTDPKNKSNTKTSSELSSESCQQGFGGFGFVPGIENTQPLLANKKQVAAMLGLSLTRFETSLRLGHIGPVPIKFGRRVLFSVSELKDWVQSRCPSRIRWISENRIRSR